MQEWRLPTEPWVFVVGADGRIAAKFEGAVGVDELVAARHEQRCRREGVHVVLAGDGPELALPEEAAGGDTEHLAQRGRVVVGDAEHLAAASRAREEQRARRPARQLAQPEVGERAQLDAGVDGVGHVKAERLADARGAADDERAGRAVAAGDAAHEVVADAVLGPVLVDHEPAHQPARREQAVGRRQLAEHRLELLERRHARKLEDNGASWMLY